MESTKRDYYFDNLKGFLIFTVVIGHIFENISSSVLRTHELVLVIYLFHMPLFTFISGYFAKRSRRSTQDKVKEMFKIYIIAQIAYILFYKLIPKFLHKASNPPSNPEPNALNFHSPLCL